MNELRKILRPLVSGAIIRDPDTKAILPEAGEEKSVNPATENGRYWIRRLAQQDVIEVVPNKASVPSQKPSLPLNKE